MNEQPQRPSYGRPRRLPWDSPEGKSCYVISDVGGGTVSDLADGIANVQLAMAVRLLRHAEELLADRTAGVRELRYLGRCLTASLTDAVRIAEGSGFRPYDGEGAEPESGRSDRVANRRDP